MDDESKFALITVRISISFVCLDHEIERKESGKSRFDHMGKWILTLRGGTLSEFGWRRVKGKSGVIMGGLEYDFVGVEMGCHVHGTVAR